MILKWIRKNVLPGVIISLALLLFLFAVGECWLRFTKPFSSNNWPSQFNEKSGFTFVPHEMVRLTNNYDFWTEQEANSIGFLDEEPKTFNEAKDAFRIVVLGDSFVEAAQVPIQKKFFRLLKNKLQKKLNRPVEIMALGYSGAGTVDALAFYRTYAKQFNPDLVILVFIGNDYANNSSLLEAVRNGWDPKHSPRPHLIMDGGKIKEVQPDPEWQKYLLSPYMSKQDYVSNIINRSAFYRYLSRQWKNFSWNKALNKEPSCEPIPDMYIHNANELMKNKDYQRQLSGWNLSNDLELDRMFYTEEKPQAFKDALLFTEHLLDKLNKEVKADGAEFLVVAAENMHRNISGTQKEFCGRIVDNAALIKTLKKMTSRNHINLYDLNDSFRAYPDQNELLFRFDGHWSSVGHEVAADALYNYLLNNPHVLGDNE